MRLIGDWERAQKILAAAPADLKQALRKALSQESLYLLTELQKNFKKVTPPNARSTIRQKGSSRPLVNDRDLYNGMQIVHKGDLEKFIGIPRSAPARGKNAKGGIVRLAEIHENGKVIVQQMTDKQRKFLHAFFKKSGGSSGGSGGGSGGVLVIHIPARPFIGPTFAANPPDKIADRMVDRIVSNLKTIPTK